MAEYGRGAKAGIVAGLVSGIIQAIGLYVLFLYLLVDIVRSTLQSSLPAGSSVTVDELLAITAYGILVGAVVAGVIGGIILGVIFAAVHNKYMRNSSLEMRGLVFGIVLWLISTLLGLGNLAYGMTYFAVATVFSLIASLIFGYLLGRFFARFGPKIPASTVPTSTPTTHVAGPM